jgi:hypothetical protein
MEGILSSPYVCAENHPISKKRTDTITVECFCTKGTFFSSTFCFSGTTFIFSKAPAFSISSIVV